jgi:dihydroflavonol-4-reductase
VEAAVTARRAPRRGDKLALVTGGTGFIGSRLVAALLKAGYGVRVLARNLAKAEPLEALGAEILVGNMFDEASLRAAVTGVDVVYHLGATMAGQWSDYVEGTIKGTDRLARAALEQGVKRFVYASSIAVCGIPSLPKGQKVTEQTPFAARDLSPYMRSKIEAERLLVEHREKSGLPATILRLGVVYGPGKGSKISRLGYPVPGGYVKVGLNSNELPSVYVDNAVRALLLAGDPERTVSAVYNVVDDVRFTQVGFLRAMGRYQKRKVRILFVPYAFLSALGATMRVLGRFNGIALRIASLTSPFHLRSCAIPVAYDNSKIKKELGWSPAPDVEAHLRETFAPTPPGLPAPSQPRLVEERRSA